MWGGGARRGYVEKLVQILGDTEVTGAEAFAEKFGEAGEPRAGRSRQRE